MNAASSMETFMAAYFGCVVWSLWFERNSVVFEQKVPDFHRFLCSLKFRLRVWGKELLGHNFVSSPFGWSYM